VIRPKLHFAAAPTPEARSAKAALARRYGSVPAASADIIVALGGDGFMLETLHGAIAGQTPIYGMNRGSVGFLMNEYREADLPARLAAAEMARIHPLTMRAHDADGRVHEVTPLASSALDRGLTLALDAIQDPGNVGTLLRIADWFAFDRVVLSPDCADLFSQKVINASMGSFARIAAHTAPLADALADCAAPVLGCDLQGDDVHALPALRDAVVVIGSEGRGLSPAVAARVTRRVTIPKFGGAESLNAAVAAAIVTHAVSFIPVVLVGMVFMAQDGLSMRRLQAMTGAARTEELPDTP